jgi:hypothetical protein
MRTSLIKTAFVRMYHALSVNPVHCTEEGEGEGGQVDPVPGLYLRAYVSIQLKAHPEAGMGGGGGIIVIHTVDRTHMCIRCAADY